MPRFVRYLVEFIAALCAIIGVLGLLLVWRLNASPINSGFLTPYIISAVEDLVPGSQVKVDGTLLTWDSSERLISLHADGITVSDSKGIKIADLPNMDAKISLIGMIFGQFMPRDLMIDHPQFKLERAKSGTFIFGGMNMGEGDGVNTDLRDVASNITQRLSHAILLNKLAVEHAVFQIHDDMSQNDWSVDVPEISVARTVLTDEDHKMIYGALRGRMTVNVTQKDDVASLDVQYIFDPIKKEHSFSTLFSDLTPAFLAGGHPETLGLGIAGIVDLPLTGKLHLTLDKDLVLQEAVAQIHGDAGSLIYPDFWDKPCPVKDLDLNATFNRAKAKLSVTDTHIDLNGPIINITVEGDDSKDPHLDMDYIAVLKVDNLPMNSYEALWPKPILPDPRYWLVSDLRDGTYTHAEAELKGGFAFGNLANLSIDDGHGKLEANNGRVTYLDGMPSAENVSADATFDLKHMDVRITGGGIGNIRMQPFTIAITGLDKPDQDIDIPLKVSGPLPEVMTLIDHDPLHYAKKLGITPDALGGNIDGTVEFRFPLLKSIAMSDIAIDAQANATNVSSNKLIPGLSLENGNLALKLDAKGFNLTGQSLINKVPFEVTWQENFEEQPGKPVRRATATGTVRDNQWDSLGISAFDGTHGPVALSVEMIKPSKNKITYNGSLDMGAAAVNVDMLGWKKPAGEPATLKFAAESQVGQSVEVTSLKLNGAGIEAAGKATLSSDMANVLSLDLTPLKLGRTDATLHFSQTFGDDGELKFAATGRSLDISGLHGSSDEPATKDNRPKEYRLKLEKLYTSPEGEIDNAEGFAVRDNQGWSEISLHGLADKDQPMNIDLEEQEDGHRTFTANCDNFGKMMKGLGFTDTIHGGKLSISGQSAADNPRAIEGKVKISDFTVTNLPVLALLLNATSPFGFPGLFTDSTDFSKLTGQYRWQADTISITKAHAAGSAIGINADGKIDLNGDANLQGTLVPFSTVNKILGFIPLLGDLLTGGEDQGVLAVSYQIKGPLANPKVSVNPVSLLAPGFIRNLFFRDDNPDDE